MVTTGVPARGACTTQLTAKDLCFLAVPFLCHTIANRPQASLCLPARAHTANYYLKLVHNFDVVDGGLFCILSTFILHFCASVCVCCTRYNTRIYKSCVYTVNRYRQICVLLIRSYSNERQLHKGQLHEEMVLSRSLYRPSG